VDNKASILKVSPIFCCLNDDELEELAGYTNLHSYKPGEYIFWEGDPPRCFCIIARGRVKLLNHSSTGKEFTIAFLNNYEMFGEVAVLQNIHYPVSAQAVIDTDVLRIKGEDFLSFLHNHPQMDLRMISILVERLREAQERLKDIAGERVEQRIARILFMLAEKSGTDLLYTRQEIAELVGTTTETAIRVILRFKEMRVIDTIRGKITILNMEKLKLLSEGPPRI
jgi:CRP-like cAMP-binding protein